MIYPLHCVVNRIRSLTGLLLLLSAGVAVAAPEPVGEAVFVQGRAEAQNIGQPARELQKGDPVYNGDRILTGDGRVQIRFVDETFVSVQPDSNYHIENFQYDEEDDSKLSAVFSLVKGGVRAVTGLISDRSKDAYKVQTPIATIGIRGTAHNTRLCQGDCPGKEDGLYHNTWTGITYVANDSGSRDVPAGRAVYVRDKDAPIQELDQIPAVTAIQETDESDEGLDEETDSVFQAGEQLSESGEETIIDDQLAAQVNFVRALVGVFLENVNEDPFFNASVLLADEVLVLRNDLPIGVLATDVLGGGVRSLGTVDPDGMLAVNDAAIGSEIESILSGVRAGDLDLVRNDPASLAEYETSSGTAWGRWADGYFLVAGEGGHRLNQLDDNQSVHFVTGPAPETMPETGSARYEFAGSTESTSTDGSTIGQGVTGGFIDVLFGNATAFLDMTVRHDSLDYDVNGSLSINGTQIGGAVSTGLNANCSDGCPTRIDGQFMGPNVDAGAGGPRDIGLNYAIDHGFNGPAPDTITGVAAFRTDGSPVQF